MKISEKLILMSANGEIAPMSSKDAMAIETALSAAEPARWLVEEHLPSGAIRWQAVEHEHHAREIASKSSRTTVAPLYRAPPAPSVAVKALEWEAREDGSHCGTSAIGRYHVFPGTGFSYDLCGPVGGRLSTHKRLSEAKAAAQADYEARIRSALSAQAQDVAIPEGWQLVPKEPTEEIIDKLTLIIRQAAWGRNNVVYQWTQLLAAAPAKQEG